MEIYSPLKISWKQLFSNFFSINVAFTEFLSKMCDSKSLWFPLCYNFQFPLFFYSHDILTKLSWNRCFIEWWRSYYNYKELLISRIFFFVSVNFWIFHTGTVNECVSKISWNRFDLDLRNILGIKNFLCHWCS